MELLIERTARRLAQRYKIDRKYQMVRDYLTSGLVRIPKSEGPETPAISGEFTIRNLEQDYRTDAEMEEKTAQFFLRNLPRARREHEEPDEMPFQEEEGIGPKFVEDNPVPYQRPRFINLWTVNDFKWLQKTLSLTLRHENWTDRFSREIRESTMKGLWNSNPDPLNLRRPDFWKKED